MLRRTVGVLKHNGRSYSVEPVGSGGAQDIGSFFDPMGRDDIFRDHLGKKIEFIYPGWGVEGTVAAESDILFSLKVVSDDTPDCLCKPVVS